MPYEVNERPRISVVICTHNRAALLGRAIESLSAQTLPAGDSETIIVNNASTDHTTRLVQELAHQKAAPTSLQLIDEPRLGLSHARNTGLAASRGCYLAFMDDDAVANPDWLESLGEAFAHSPRTAIVGGPVEPIWPHPPPSWLAERSLRHYCSIVDLGEVTRPIDTESEWFAGTNIAFLRTALLEIGGFSVSLGRTGANLLSNEETDAVTRLTKNGYKAWYAHNAKVRHHVHAHRMTRRWLLHRAFWQGISDIALGAPSLSRHLGKLSRRRVDLVLLRSLGKDWTKEYLAHEVLKRPTRMASLASQARKLGIDFAHRHI